MQGDIRATRRAGFTLVEIVVALAIMVVLTSMSVSALASYLDDKRVTQTAATLDELQVALKSFKTTVGFYPSRLSHLARPILAGEATGCTGTAPTYLVSYSTTQATKWSSTGPFYYLPISTLGFPLPIGTANDLMTRNKVNNAGGLQMITITNVGSDDANALNVLVDGPVDTNLANGSNNQGGVQFGTATSGTVTLTYGISVEKGC